MILGVPKESYPGERRVALVPLVVPNLIKAGFEVVVEASAGMKQATGNMSRKGQKLSLTAPTPSLHPTLFCKFFATDLTMLAERPTCHSCVVAKS